MTLRFWGDVAVRHWEPSCRVWDGGNRSPRPCWLCGEGREVGDTPVHPGLVVPWPVLLPGRWER